MSQLPAFAPMLYGMGIVDETQTAVIDSLMKQCALPFFSFVLFLCFADLCCVKGGFIDAGRSLGRGIFALE